MLPAGDFLEDEQADAVAMVEEPLGLRIMRGAHEVAMQRVLQDLGIALLRRAAHGVADIGESLMAVEAADFQRPSVELETIRGELGGAEAEA
ncbi:hypothetical protein D3C71_1739870 [compost metagenome]